MIQTELKTRRMLPSRIVRAMLAAMIAVGALIAGSTSASADPVCRQTNGSNICFSIEPIGNNDYAVHIGIDVTMSRQDAEAILAPPGDEFLAKLYGDDYWYDNFLKYVPLTWSAAWDGGLSAEFDGVVDGCVLDEDYGGGDEVYGRVFLYDHRSNTTRTFDTNVISRSFSC
ncbi:MAG TPA: hypothetical protein VES02_02775 [Dermatophilaceae bacterium]|nr:hypothetical protein [Dermatophilaceae bacterium]